MVDGCAIAGAIRSGSLMLEPRIRRWPGASGCPGIGRGSTGIGRRINVYGLMGIMWE